MLQEKNVPFDDNVVRNIAKLKKALGVTKFPASVRGPNVSGSDKAKKAVKTAANALRGLDGEPKDISDDDIKTANNMPDDDVAKQLAYYVANNSSNSEIKSAWQNLVTLISAEDPTKLGNIKDIDLDSQTYEPDSIAYGQMASIGAQADPNKPSSLGQFPEGVAAAMNTFFAGKNTFASRLEAISEFSTTVFSDKKLNSYTTNQVLAASLVNDYLTTIVKEMDSGTGAYMFETFLAILAGGKVTGKGDVEDENSTGQMGAVDFTMNDGSFGSAKYYSKGGSGVITQAISGFSGTGRKGEDVLYVIAIKKKDDTTTLTTGGTAEPREIKQLNVYLVSVTPITDTPNEASDFRMRVNGATTDVVMDAPHSTDTKINISKGLGSSTPIILTMAGGGGKSFREMLQSSASKSSAEIKKSIPKFVEALRELYKSNQKIERYASTGDTSVGNDALDSLNKADDAFIGLSIAIQGTNKSAKDIKKDRKLDENKMTELDLMVENMVKQFIKGNLND
jgi:hypothetical protein